MNEPVQIALATESRFARGMIVAAHSALHHLPEGTRATVTVIHENLPEKWWDHLEKSLAATGKLAGIERVPLASLSLGNVPVDSPSRLLAYGRLGLPVIVPASRVIYLDVDIVVHRDLSELWTMPMEGALALACVDQMLPTHAHEWETYHIPPPADGPGPRGDSPYFNSGIMTMDLDAWRREDTSGAVLDYIRTQPGRCALWDQSALNVVLHERWNAIPECWNYLAKHVNAKRLDAAASGINVHFTGHQKPWVYAGKGFHAARYFFEALDRTTLRGWRPTLLGHAGIRLRELAVAGADGLIRPARTAPKCAVPITGR